MGIPKDSGPSGPIKSSHNFDLGKTHKILDSQDSNFNNNNIIVNYILYGPKRRFPDYSGSRTHQIYHIHQIYRTNSNFKIIPLRQYSDLV